LACASPEACAVIEDFLSGVTAAIRDRRFVDPHGYNKQGDCVPGSVLEIAVLLRNHVK